MIIGVLKESGDETRVALFPDVVKSLSKSNQIIIESDAGESALINDEMFKASGAEIKNKEEIISSAELLIKVNKFTEEELDSMKEGQVICSVLAPLFDPQYIKNIADRKLTAFSMDSIPRITRAQSMDVLSSMSTVSGYKAVLEAAMHLPRFFPMFMTAAGTIRPAQVLILGVGVAGLQAIATAKRLGAVVTATDTRMSTKEQVESLGGKFLVVDGAVEDKAAGGYAVEQSEDFKVKQAALIKETIIKSDVVITTALIPGRPAPKLVTKEMVDQMKPGSVIIDLASITGGNCELTKDGEVVKHNGITIVGNSNYPHTMPEDASRMYAKNVQNLLALLIDKEGNFNLNLEDEVVSGTLVAHNGDVVSERIKNLL